MKTPEIARYLYEAHRQKVHSTLTYAQMQQCGAFGEDYWLSMAEAAQKLIKTEGLCREIDRLKNDSENHEESIKNLNRELEEKNRYIEMLTDKIENIEIDLKE